MLVTSVTSGRANCLTNLSQPLEIYVDDETKLTLHGLQQHYIKLEENAKNRKLNDLLDSLEFNQVCALLELRIPYVTEAKLNF